VAPKNDRYERDKSMSSPSRCVFDKNQMCRPTMPRGMKKSSELVNAIGTIVSLF
jgi:hypothetical protein